VAVWVADWASKGSISPNSSDIRTGPPRNRALAEFWPWEIVGFLQGNTPHDRSFLQSIKAKFAILPKKFSGLRIFQS